MISENALLLAVERGLVSADQAAGLRAIEAEQVNSGAEPQDDEKLRFISGFADIFVTIGLVLFLGTTAYFLRSFGPVPTWAGVAVTSWLLAEFFTRRRRMALPSIVLLVVFAGAVFLAMAIQIQAWWAPTGKTIDWWNPLGTLDAKNPWPLIVSALGTIAFVALHFWRFRVPITVAAGAAAAVVLVLGLLFAFLPAIVTAWINWVILVLGLCVFALAMRFDLSDPQRATRRTDIAFWLHLLAAPMIVHPLIAGLFHGASAPTIGSAVGILAVFLGLAVVAILVDRRALLVSGLAYAGIAFGTILEKVGLSDETVPATLFSLGAFVLLLSAGWRMLRRGALTLLPAGFAQRLPHPSSNLTS